MRESYFKRVCHENFNDLFYKEKITFDKKEEEENQGEMKLEF